jgi:hypothetical protein
MKKQGHWGMALRAHERGLDAIGEMNAAWWDAREAKARRLGIETKPDLRPIPKPERERRSVLELLLD